MRHDESQFFVWERPHSFVMNLFITLCFVVVIEFVKWSWCWASLVTWVKGEKQNERGAWLGGKEEKGAYEKLEASLQAKIDYNMWDGIMECDI